MSHEWIKKQCVCVSVCVCVCECVCVQWDRLAMRDKGLVPLERIQMNVEGVRLSKTS